ncbi:MAG: DnaJ family molecular chaperone [Armatimonadota bacterium]
MSIPDRLWRVVKGHWSIATQRVSELEAQAAAYQELADALKQSPPVPASTAPDGSRVLPPTPPPTPMTNTHDPLEACYTLLQLNPGADLATVERAYQARLAEWQPDQYRPGTPERAAVESRRTAIQAAYDKLRDALNPVETRFERLEF